MEDRFFIVPFMIKEVKRKLLESIILQDILALTGQVAIHFYS